MDFFTYSLTLATLVLLSHIALVLFFLSYWLQRVFAKRFLEPVLCFLGRYGILLACGIAVIATLAPLIYTHVYYLSPCVLCWYQRIFMFPLPVILLAMYLRNRPGEKIYVYPSR